MFMVPVGGNIFKNMNVHFLLSNEEKNSDFKRIDKR